MRIVLLLLLLTTTTTQAFEEYYFRVQCYSNDRVIAQSELEKIPEIEYYIQRTGRKLYFSGGVYVHYSDAKARLEMLLSKGFKEAFIRVFHRNVLMKGKNHDRHMPIAIERSLENEVFIRRKEREKAEFVKLDSIRSNLIRERIASNKRNHQDSTSISTNTNKSDSIIDGSTKEEEVVVEVGYSVDEPVYYVLQIAIGLKGEPSPKKLESINEIVYQHQDGNKMIYYIGKSQELNEVVLLQNRMRNTQSGLKIVGFYKGRIISLPLAQELSLVYASQN